MAAILQSPLMRDYPLPRGRVDEMLSDTGGIRESWRYMAEALDGLGTETLRQRHQQARRLLRERGVTYNVYGDPQGSERLWELDPVPLLLASDEWSEVEAGLHRRAELFNLILKDIYGPQELIKRGVLPQELVHTHPGFLRACHPYPERLDYPLTLYAADLARGPDGGFRVVGDRTQSPSGAGYALENRVVMTRILPSLFRESRVHRLALFFQQLRSALAEMAPKRDSEEPRVVLLTPGLLNETYFEHSFLAGYLGYTLVEGSDLTVRDGRVWLRSMRRLEPVDVILRRLDDDYCDAVELRSDSMLGVPGLTEVVRRGRVAIANPLGSGVLENPALKAFLPAISRHFLGHDLDLPSVETYWCGDPESCRFVLDNLHRLVLKSIYRGAGQSPLFGAALSGEERERMAARIRARPHLYVGQEQGRLSSAPTLTEDGGLVPRPAVLRTFMVGRKGGYSVMPGGLARIAASIDSPSVSNQVGGLSKDIWIQATEPVREVSLLPSEESAGPVAEMRAMLPPAAAENLFWMSRYAERAELSIRVLRTVLRVHRSVAEYGDGAERPVLARLERALTRVTATYPGFTGPGADARMEDPLSEFSALVFDSRRTGSLAFNLHAMLTASNAVRDRLSGDTLRVLTSIRARLAGARVSAGQALRELPTELDELITLLASIRGLEQDSMMHGQGWRFLELGRRIERGLLTGALLRATVVEPLGGPVEPVLLEAVLGCLESLNPYRRYYPDTPRLEPLLRLVLTSERNPRALGYQLAHLLENLRELPGDGGPDQLSHEQRLVLEAHTSLKLSDMDALARVDADRGERSALARLLELTDRDLKAAATQLALSYFTDQQGPRPLGGALVGQEAPGP